MNVPRDEKLSPALSKAVEMAREVPVAAGQVAQVRLASALQSRTRHVPRVARRWAVAGLAAAAAITLAITVPLLPGHGDAFAAAQAHFRDFRTLQMDVVQRHGDTVMQTSRTRVNAAGATRTDIGESLSVIVDPARGRVLTLLHDERKALVADMPTGDADIGLGAPWLEELRHFTGKATPLPATRVIEGLDAQGWSLNLAGNATELWTSADGLPLELRMHGAGMQIDYRFAFDIGFGEDLFDSTVPSGFSEAGMDAD